MKVFKFGGASVKNPESVKNIAKIIGNYSEDLVIVISAMGKTTNALEEVVEHYYNRTNMLDEKIQVVKSYHYDILNSLFPDKSDPVFRRIELIFSLLESKLSDEPALNYHFEYDQIVSYGEILSTIIVSEYLRSTLVSNKWLDIRKYLKTNSNFREARIDWELSEKLIQKNFDCNKHHIIITQGFIGSNQNNSTTTLGREGSDFSAAILAYMLNATDVTVWKDVPGVLNADPKWFDDTVLINQLSYLDAIELAFYGMSVIHPRTIQPLKNKNIRLYVKSFLNPALPGTVIGNEKYDDLVPCFIFKMDQVLVEIYPKDFSFVAEDNLEIIFNALATNGLKVNLMQNTAVSFRICVNADTLRLNKVEELLREHFNMTFEPNLELITIRYFDQTTIDRVMRSKQLVLEQRSEKTIQMIVRNV